MEISVPLGLRLTAPSVVDAPQMEPAQGFCAIAGDNVTRENDEPRSPARTVKPAEKSWFIVSKFRL